MTGTFSRAVAEGPARLLRVRRAQNEAFEEVPEVSRRSWCEQWQLARWNGEA
jgi:hypothetical protein